MTRSNIQEQASPKIRVEGPLYQLIRQGAIRLIASAVDAELEDFLEQHAILVTAEGARAVVRNGYLPKRTLHTSIGYIDIQIPRVRDRSSLGIHFTSLLVPPYLKRAQDQQELLPWLYLTGFVSGNFKEVLSALLGIDLEKISPTILSRLQTKWRSEHGIWQQRSLQNTRYLYWRADCFTGSVANEELSILVIAGITEDGRQELVSIDAGAPSSEAEWLEILRDLQQRGLAAGPKLADGEHVEGFWQAVGAIFPDTLNAVHKPQNQPEQVLNAFPSNSHPDTTRLFFPVR